MERRAASLDPPADVEDEERAGHSSSGERREHALGLGNCQKAAFESARSNAPHASAAAPASAKTRSARRIVV
jgi:hypothetical protein